MERLRALARFARHDHRSAFQHIYDRRYWGDQESVSGWGSRQGQTENIRARLPALVREYGIRSMLDAPCGDLYWMAQILPAMDIRYIGGDIVPSVVDLARRRYQAADTSFMTFDITADPFPDVDAWLCRDVLFHLSHANIMKALRGFAASPIRYVLLTSHTAPGIRNRNIVTGDFRQLNLFEPPYSLPIEGVLERFDDYAPPAPERAIFMLTREAVASRLG